MNKKSFIAKHHSIALVGVLALPLAFVLARPTPSAARDRESGMGFCDALRFFGCCNGIRDELDNE